MPFPQPPFNSPIQTEPTIKGVVTIKSVWQNWLQLVQTYLANLTGSGPTVARPTQNLWVGMPFFDTTINAPVYWDGSTWVTSAPSGVSAVTGTAPIASSGGSTPNISISQSGASSDGYLSSTDWNTFNSKVSTVGATSPVTSTGGSNPVIGMPAASSSVSGYLTSADWNTFNGSSTRGFVDVAVTYGTTTAAIQNAINANPGRTLYFKAGVWQITSTIYINNTCTLLGDNPQTNYYFEKDPSTLPEIGTVFQISTSLTSDAIVVGTGGAVVFQNIGFQPESIAQIKGTVSDYYYLPSSPSVGDKWIASAPSNFLHPALPFVDSKNYIFQWNGSSWVSLGNPARASGSYIAVYAGIGNQNVNFGTKVNNCHFVFGYYSLFFADSAYFGVTGCYMANTAYVDVYVANGPNGSWQNDYGDSFITNNYMDFWVGYTVGNALAHVYQVSSGGLKITGNKFLAGQRAWYINPGSNDLNIGTFVGNSAEGCAVAALVIVGGTKVDTHPNQLMITGNQLSSFGSSGVLIDGSKASNIIINGNVIGAASGGYGITLQNGAGSNGVGILITANNIFGPCGGIALLDTSKAYVSPNLMSVTGPRFNIVSTTSTYAVGQAQNANGVYSGSYGAYGSVYISNAITVNFPSAFPAVPIVNVTLDNPTTVLSAGGVGCLVRNVSTTGFTLYIITVASAGQVNYSFNAYLTGQ